MTPGMKTSEFAIAVLILLATSVLLALGNITEETWVDLTQWIGSGYLISRGLSKITTGGDRLTSTTESVVHTVEEREEP